MTFGIDLIGLIRDVELVRCGVEHKSRFYCFLTFGSMANRALGEA
jgi:hypothetical protein